ncbi:MAG: hypothetical protein KGQ60_04085 [Planctomycetes bacterium]|nr:hypothetical protein [Planctomycetota bacterium]
MQEIKRELLIVEGDSAANAVRQYATHHQTVLALQGKPINALKATHAQVLANEFLCAILDRLDDREAEANRVKPHHPFEQVALLMDPDPDGVHCGLLILWFFYRYLRSWLDEGRLLQIVAPRLEVFDVERNRSHFAYTQKGADSIADQIRAKHGEVVLQVRKVRGLAAMPSDVLQKQCVSQDTRRQIVLNAEDAEKGWMQGPDPIR